MAMSLKSLSDQTIVVTGASSGIGLATARRAAKAGAKVVLVARNEDALREAAAAIRADGGQATHIALDMAEADAPERIGAHARATFGGFDTWVNNAASSVYARLEETSLDEHRRVFEVGYFAYVSASLYAARELRKRGGGALINVGSVLSERSVPVQGAYSAMKHAVLGFTESLRMDLENEGAPVSVTLIKPNGIDTPYAEHARNKMGKPATVPPIVYAPELVAKAICFAAAHPKRELTVGGNGYTLTGLANMFPRAADLVMERVMVENGQSTDQPPEPGTQDNLFEPRRDGRAHSNKVMYVRKRSIGLEAQMRPLAAAAIVGGLGAAIVAAATLRRRPDTPDYPIGSAAAPEAYEMEMADDSAVPIDTAEETVFVATVIEDIPGDALLAGAAPRQTGDADGQGAIAAGIATGVVPDTDSTATTPDTGDGDEAIGTRQADGGVAPQAGASGQPGPYPSAAEIKVGSAN